MEIRLCAMEIDHLPAVLRIEGNSLNPPASEALWKKELATLHSRNYVAVARPGGTEEIIGFINYWIVAGEVQLNSIAVKREYRRMGVAGRLLETMAASAVTEGATVATLEVRAANEPAIKLYEKHAFVIKGRRKRYYDDGDDALIMWSDLK